MIEIDGVQRAFESPVWTSGDYASDAWLETIELATAKDLGAKNETALARAIKWMNHYIPDVQILLETDDRHDANMIEVYNSAVDQINSINQSRCPQVGQLITAQSVITV